jgi:hypothetical protein
LTNKAFGLNVSIRMEFKHPKLFEQVTAIGGHYTFVKDETASINGRDVLYLVGIGAVDTSCCGTGGCIYALVPGYITERTSEGSPSKCERVSQVEAVSPEDMKEIFDLLRRTEGITQAVFLTGDGSAMSLI